MDKNGYQWKFCSLGGVTRVNIASGEDIAHLGELDQKLWTVLSCPVKGLEFDRKTLELLDTDGDGKIRVAEIVAAAEWLTSVLKDKDSILKGEDELPLSQINTDCEAGKKLYDSARQILSNLGLEKDSITLEEASDSVKIFADTAANGDGVITLKSTEDEELKAAISLIVEKIGSAADRSGEAGVTADHIEAFYTALAEYDAWQAAAAADSANVFPYGDNTAAALAACEAVKDKVADYFMRCKLVAFDADVAGAVDVSAEKVAAITEMNLATQTEEISKYPLARPQKDCVLPFDGINPAWQPAFAALKALVLDADFPDAKAITEAEWEATLAKFGPYTAWLADKKGAAVEGLGTEAVAELLKADRKAALLDLIAADKALEEEANSIDEVGRLLHYYKYFYKLLKNYVFFYDFYDVTTANNSVFDAGELYIDQRCCHLCVRVEDMGAHAEMAGLSGMFLIYCTCTSKTKGETMNIVAAMTDGNTKLLRPGKNAIFYDRDGVDWDAVVTKVVENPISIKQAFWRPYVKFANTISDRINKNMEEKESKVLASVAESANNVKVDPAGGEKPAALPKSFDIAKFAGIFAAIGMAVAYLTTALAKIVNPWYNVLIVLAVLVVLISGPSMFLAWQKLRKRNLGPVLNANGWAINSVVLINILFGRTLTSVAQYPHIKVDDPFNPKTPFWKVLLWIILVLAIAFAVLYFTNHLSFIGLPYQK